MLKTFLLTLLLLLDAPQWRLREVATSALTRLAPLVLEALERAERDGSPEAARRCSAILGHYYRANADRLSRRLKDLPPIGLMGRWVIGQSYDDSWIVWAVMLHYECQALGGQRAASWVARGAWWDFDDPPEVQREATRLWLRDLIAARQDVQAALARLRR